ncbi:MAG: glycosyltransferase family 2 protein [Mastigocoleus sp.]
MIKTPVAFIIFKRPDTTEKVFEVIRQVKPPKLLVIADGARADIPGELEKCKATRAIVDRVDWECEVLKNYSDINLGCRLRPATGINWVFEQVEQAIFLEDDCVPDPSFFQYCEKLLEKYKEDPRIMTICGTNVQGEWKSDIQSYHFSYYGKGWGWASWRRAWRHYDVDMKIWSHPEIKNAIQSVVSDKKQYSSLEKIFNKTYSGEIITAWDYQWLFCRLHQSGMAIIPSRNLVENIGNGADATHTNDVASIPIFPMSFPLTEPSHVTVDRDFDNLVYKSGFSKPSLLKRLMKKINQLLTISI